VLTIASRPLPEVRIQIANYLEQIPSECKNLLSALHSTGDPTFQPTIQLSYDEISGHDIDRLLGYAGISSANTPIGIDAAFLPLVLGTDPKSQVLLFSLAELEAHLARAEPAIAERFRTLGSMDQFVADRGDAMTAVEYLTGGTLECISFCRAKKQAMIVRW
jgi:hypothetical protein